MNWLLEIFDRSSFRQGSLDKHLIRAAMVTIFLFFGYQKWFAYEAQVLIPYISNGPLIFWLYPAFGIQGASWFLGVAEWLICILLFLGFWNKTAGVYGAIGSTFAFLSTVTIIPFMPNAWDAAAGGFPAMTGNTPFLMKDVVLLTASLYLLKQDLFDVSLNPSSSKNLLAKRLAESADRLGVLRSALDYHLLRGAMVIIFAFFGYTKWHPYSGPILEPLIRNGPLIFWLYPAFGLHGATRFLGATEWTVCALFYAGFWDKRLGALGALGSSGTFIGTLTILPFLPDAWAASAGGFPAMAENAAFLMKDFALLAVSLYLLKQDLIRVSAAARSGALGSKEHQMALR
jgi:uncharacterized membrane protein YkgB